MSVSATPINEPLPEPEVPETPVAPDSDPNKAMLPLIVGSLGVVFGDIGTSPLYAFRESVMAAGGVEHLQTSVMGVLSLIIWSLILVVTIKYVSVLLYADNHGEGGSLSLMALAQRGLGKRTKTLVVLGALGAALFYGDAAITPAISVLSAVEGMELVTPTFKPFVVPITLILLSILFFFQHRGTEKVARFFGPITGFWFLAMAIAGIPSIVRHPDVLYAFSPVHGASLLLSEPGLALVILGAVFLAVTGTEALYTDLGHFGRRPIQRAWLFVVFPCLVINYLGQGALVLVEPEAIEHPFFKLVPEPMLLPLVVLAGLATIIASQAVITGTSSLTKQAILLNLMPRLEIRHTSEHHSGQIYMPRVNLWLYIGVVLLVAAFGSSSRLAAAYGIAVTGTMVVTGLMAFIVVWKFWHVRPWVAALLIGPFMLLDFTFLWANLLKVFQGGWLPLGIAAIMVVVLLTWVRGSRILYDRQRRTEVPIEELHNIIESRHIVRVPGTAIFLTADPSTVPSSMMHNLKHNKVLHEQNVILTMKTLDRPRVDDPSNRVSMKMLNDGILHITMRYGFMETPNVLKGLAQCRELGWKFDIMQTTFFLSRRTIHPAAKSGMPIWQDKLFITMAKNANTATDFFRLPADQVLEVGTHVKI